MAAVAQPGQLTVQFRPTPAADAVVSLQLSRHAFRASISIAPRIEVRMSETRHLERSTESGPQQSGCLSAPREFAGPVRHDHPTASWNGDVRSAGWCRKSSGGHAACPAAEPPPTKSPAPQTRPGRNRRVGSRQPRAPQVVCSSAAYAGHEVGERSGLGSEQIRPLPTSTTPPGRGRLPHQDRAPRPARPETPALARVSVAWCARCRARALHGADQPVNQIALGRTRGNRVNMQQQWMVRQQQSPAPNRIDDGGRLRRPRRSPESTTSSGSPRPARRNPNCGKVRRAPSRTPMTSRQKDATGGPPRSRRRPAVIGRTATRR